MKKLYSLALSFALLALVACSDNLFGSSSPDKGDSIKSLRIDAENAFRKGDYKGSYSLCSLIVYRDSTVSFGYFGMAKASLWMHNINPLGIFSLVKEKDGVCPFIGEPVKLQNDYFQAMKKIVLVLAKLDRRDSLTVLWGFHDRAKKNKGWDSTFVVTIDSVTRPVNLDTRLSKFREVFCGGGKNNDCNDTIPGGISSGKPFPLSDREYKSSYFGGILLLSVFTKWFLNFLDTNGDECIAMKGESGIANPGNDKNDSKWKKWGCIKKFGEYAYDLPMTLECPRDSITGQMNVIINTEKVLEALQDELEDYYKNLENCADADCVASSSKLIPQEIGNLNDKIDEFQGTFKEVENVLDGLGLSGGDDTTSLKDEVDKYKAYASFYKMGTHIDEDGDGCIDEELLNGRDSDGDSLINENTRIAPIDLEHELYGIESGKYGLNPINNFMVTIDGQFSPYRNDANWEYNKLDTLQRMEDDEPEKIMICNSPDCKEWTPIYPKNEDENWVTVLRFTQKIYPGTTNQKYWTSRNLDLKLAVAQDTTCPPKITLEERKQKIGGCWPNYDECKFVKYILRRELSLPDPKTGQRRVHPDCLTYKIHECP